MLKRKGGKLDSAGWWKFQEEFSRRESILRTARVLGDSGWARERKKQRKEKKTIITERFPKPFWLWIMFIHFLDSLVCWFHVQWVCTSSPVLCFLPLIFPTSFSFSFSLPLLSLFPFPPERSCKMPSREADSTIMVAGCHGNTQILRPWVLPERAGIKPCLGQRARLSLGFLDKGSQERDDHSRYRSMTTEKS